VAQKEFWKVIGRKPDFWISLEPMPDAMVLWKFLTNHFKDPVPVILSAGQGSTVQQQKTEWIRKHISPDVKVLIAPSGVKKPEFIINHPVEGGKYVTHVLIDDTSKNISAWDNQANHRIAIHHRSAGETIKALQPYITK
jgi:5'(3')-deoxyribonucleotidase